MSLQHHFVVFIEDGKAYIDYDSTGDRFHDGEIWNTQLEIWEDKSEHPEKYETAHDLIEQLLAEREKQNGNN